MSDTAKIISACIVAVVLFSIGISVSVSVWSECRADGNSFLYCMKLISR